MSHAIAFQLTRHGETRMQQRGLWHQAIALALTVHDVEVHVGEGCEAWSVSRKRVQALRSAGLPAVLVERVHKAILIVDPLTRTIVTVINGHLDATKRLRRKGSGLQWRSKHRRWSGTASPARAAGIAEPGHNVVGS